MTKGFPEADVSLKSKKIVAVLGCKLTIFGLPSQQMPKYDATFKEMESFTMQPQWLAVSR